jgi:hypothetical protein
MACLTVLKSLFLCTKLFEIFEAEIFTILLAEREFPKISVPVPKYRFKFLINQNGSYKMVKTIKNYSCNYWSISCL